MKKKINSSPWFGIFKDKKRYYKGLLQKTDLYVHECIVEQIKKTGLDLKQENVRVLDLGCGEGALSLRLYDEGAKVIAVDIDKENFKADGPEFKYVDFNNSKSIDDFVEENEKGFDVIVASEVIEHLRNPWQLMFIINRLSSFETEIIITTPNVSSWWGRFWFFVTGELWGFGREGWRDPGHINPITDERFNCIADEMGFNVVSSVNTGVLPIIWAYNWKRLIVSLLCLPFRGLQKGKLDGWVTLYNLKKRP